MKKIILLFLFVLSSFLVRAQITLTITDFGAVGNGTTINTIAIQAAIDSCTSAGGGTVVVPVGTFMSGTIFLKNNVLLQIDSLATLRGSSDVSDYPEIVSQVHGMADDYKHRSLIYAEGQHNIGLIGKGTFDGNGLALTFVLTSANRAFGVRFISCTNVRYENIIMKSSSFWMMHNLNCDSLFISGLNVNNQGAGNNDGIGIDGCRHVRIHDCTVNSFDDALVMKNTSAVEMYDVEVYNCSLSSLARVIKIGTETIGDIHNIHVHDCTVSEGILGQPGEIGINIATIDGSHIDSVTIENIAISGVQIPIVVRLGDSNRQYIDSLPPLPAGTFKNILLKSISGSGLNDLPCHITGIPGHTLENVHLKNISLTIPGGSVAVDPMYVVPENIAERPEIELLGTTLPAYGIYFRHVNGLTLDSVCITPTQPDARAMIWVDDVQDTTINAVCQPILAGVKESVLKANSKQVVYNRQTNSVQLKNFGSGQFNLYSIDGRLILSVSPENSLTTINCFVFPFAWRFVARAGKMETGKVWLEE